jgi:membrane fusion protein (multidrug efflux system)
MFVREIIQDGVRQNGLLVPQRGVTHDERGTPTALVVGPDDKVEARSLVTDRAIGTNWLVTSGLRPGERVIVSGLQLAKPGQEVHVHTVTVTDSGLKPQTQ